jgi:hypothetical protein
MKLSLTSIKVFMIAFVIYFASFVCCSVAKTVSNKEIAQQLEEGRKAGIFHTESPDFNFWDYSAIATLILGIAITIAGLRLRKLDN